MSARDIFEFDDGGVGLSVECRSLCGACCIAPSISAPIPGMPQGKPAGVACIHLNDEYQCLIFHDPKRPDTCRQFQAESAICGTSREQALTIITDLEVITSS